MENNRFEDSFRNAFDGAEVSPSSGVWTNIELTLEKNSGGQLKRNLLLFQLLAAASVVFACGIGAMYYTANQSGTRPEFTNELSNTQNELNKEGSNEVRKETSGSLKEESLSAKTQSKIVEEQALNSKLTSNKPVTRHETFNTKNVDGSSKKDEILLVVNEHKGDMYTITRRELSAVRVAAPEFVLPEAEKPVEPDAFEVMMARLRDEEKKYQQDDKKKSSENVWASVGFGAGSYKPNRHALSNNSSATGESYSAGLHVAGRVSKRFVVQGGVSYLSQNADFTSTRSAQGAAMLNEYASSPVPQDIGGAGESTPYVVNSAMQYVSIPVQAGYLIIDRAFGVQVNGGIATDLFINNTLSTENGDYQKVTQAAGKESPYRTVNFSGLLGTEFSYRIADQYRISLNPGLRYSLNSIYKDEIAATITPVTFDVSLRFRYIFK